MEKIELLRVTNFLIVQKLFLSIPLESSFIQSKATTLSKYHFRWPSRFPGLELSKVNNGDTTTVVECKNIRNFVIHKIS